MFSKVYVKLNEIKSLTNFRELYSFIKMINKKF
jgi:hypothetical protein